MSQPLYKRVMLKLSGEALQGNGRFGIDSATLNGYATQIAEVIRQGVQVAIVIGGGNLFRGAALSQLGDIRRTTADQIAMLATTINSLAMRDALENCGVETELMSAIPMDSMIQGFDEHKAISALEAGKAVIFAAGTGNPFFTTDTTASLRGLQIQADVLLKATSVDGIYTADPALDNSAVKLSNLSFQEVLDNEYGVMDLSAFCQCRDHHLPIRVFNLNQANAIVSIVTDSSIGTLVS